MKAIVTILLACTVYAVSAQIVVDSSATYKAEAYAGILTGPSFTRSEKKVGVTGFANVRIAASLAWKPQKWFAFNAIAAIQVDNLPTVTYAYLAGVQLLPHPNVVLSLGKIASPMTELRPMPHTGGGQFEPWTRRQIPGSAFGGKLMYRITDKVSVVAGGFWRSDSVTTVEAGVSVPFVKMAGYYQPQGNLFGAALFFESRYVRQAVTYNHCQSLGFFTSVSVPGTKGMLLISDVGFNPLGFDFIRGEWGILKVATIKRVNMLIGLTYCKESRSVNGYVQINL